MLAGSRPSGGRSVSEGLGVLSRSGVKSILFLALVTVGTHTARQADGLEIIPKRKPYGRPDAGPQPLPVRAHASVRQRKAAGLASIYIQ